MSFFVDVSGRTAQSSSDSWEPVIIPRAEIDAEAARLGALVAPPGGRRESLIVHPRAASPGNGLAPGIRVTLSVLLPGEHTEPIRHNSTQVSFCIAGGGTAVVGDKKIGFTRYDVWNHPAWTTYSYTNDTDTPQVRLTYSNAALLDQLGVHLVEQNPAEETTTAEQATDPSKVNPYGTVQLTDDGARLMPYELLISPPDVEADALHWPWQQGCSA